MVTNHDVALGRLRTLDTNSQCSADVQNDSMCFSACVAWFTYWAGKYGTDTGALSAGACCRAESGAAALLPECIHCIVPNIATTTSTISPAMRCPVPNSLMVRLVNLRKCS